MESDLKATQVRWRLSGRERQDEDEATDDEKVTTVVGWAKKTECPAAALAVPTLPPLTDPDVLSLAAGPHQTAYDLCLNAMAGHTERIFRFIQAKSKRDIDQFCFGSTYVQLNPNFRKFDRMDPMTWKKEGIASKWTGARGYRKKCCKVCCTDITCNGCGLCKGCNNAPIRGNYDGLVVLAAVSRETLPNYPNAIRATTLQAKKQQEKLLDHVQFALNLEFALTSHFMYSGNNAELQSKCVPSNRMAVAAGDSIDDGKSKPKKFPSYVVYVAYRLEPGYGAYNHHAKMSQKMSHLTDPAIDEDGPSGEADQIISRQRSPLSHLADPTALGGGSYDVEDIDNFEYGKSVPDDPTFNDFEGAENDEEVDEKLLEDLEDKQLRERISSLETDHSNTKEQVWKLEHGRNWMENRLTALEAELKDLKEEKSEKATS